MGLQYIFIEIILLFSIYFHIQGKSFLPKYNVIIELSNHTYQFTVTMNSSLCILDSNCQKNSWCNRNKCQCKEGWLTIYNNNNNNQCSYKQISKSSTLILSLLMGSFGIDWFILSRQNILYILTGLLKFLILIAACIWNRLVISIHTQTLVSFPVGLAVSLSFISLIWWCIDWIRIIFNKFPDGNGIPLI